MHRRHRSYKSTGHLYQNSLCTDTYFLANQVTHVKPLNQITFPVPSKCSPTANITPTRYDGIACSVRTRSCRNCRHQPHLPATPPPLHLSNHYIQVTTLTTTSSSLFEKLIFAQVTKKLTALYGTQTFIKLFRTPSLLTLSRLRRLSSTFSNHFSLKSILILSSHILPTRESRCAVHKLISTAATFKKENVLDVLSMYQNIGILDAPPTMSIPLSSIRPIFRDSALRKQKYYSP